MGNRRAIAISASLIEGNAAGTAERAALKPGIIKGEVIEGTEGLRLSRYTELTRLLEEEHPEFDRVWASYLEYCNLYGSQDLPLDVHSSALRKGVPTREQLNRFVQKDLKSGRLSFTAPYKWEFRFQEVIRSMHRSRLAPPLEDFHFILQQFAISGHFKGSRSILKVIDRFTVKPNHITYGLCLKATAFRLKLPYEEESRASMVHEASQFCMDILRAMAKAQTLYTSINLDLCARILKESLDVRSLEQFLETGYGINLTYPDQPPLKQSVAHQKDMPNTHLPITTSTLNTTIDIFGKRSHLSKMIIAFETLTQPLDAYYSTPSRDFDDDDDWPSFDESLAQKPPYAQPNTTTYNYLIKHCSQIGNFTMARHYILELFDLDQRVTRKLIQDLATNGRETVVAPKFAITRRTLLPLWGWSHRDKHRPLAEWVKKLCEEAIQRKNGSLDFFRKARTHQEEEDDSEYSELIRHEDGKDAASILEIDIEDDTPLSSTKVFDEKLHVRILRQDLRELEDLLEVVNEGIDRIRIRIKERLRRRVWEGKDIFLADRGSRVILPRDNWRHISIPPEESTRHVPQYRGGWKPNSPYFTPSYGRERTAEDK